MGNRWVGERQKGAGQGILLVGQAGRQVGLDCPKWQQNDNMCVQTSGLKKEKGWMRRLNLKTLTDVSVLNMNANAGKVGESQHDIPRQSMRKEVGRQWLLTSLLYVHGGIMHLWFWMVSVYNEMCVCNIRALAWERKPTEAALCYSKNYKWLPLCQASVLLTNPRAIQYARVCVLYYICILYICLCVAIRRCY